MKNLFNKSLLVATCLLISMPAYAIPVVDGFLDAEYIESFTAGWYNGHEQAGSQFKKSDNHTTTVYWKSTSTNFFLYLEAPLEAKNMIWGTGFTHDEALSYYQQWCSPTDGKRAALDGSNCGHHDKGFDEFIKKTDFGGMTGSEKVIFGQGLFKDSHGFQVFDEKNLNGVNGNLAGVASGTFYGNILDYKDSVDYVTNSLGCDTINCDASDTPMAFEFKFGAFTDQQREKLISDITNNELEFHLSPERGAAAPTTTTSRVPEPSSVILLGLGLAALGFSRKKKNT